MTALSFWKLEGAGNDFVLLDGRAGLPRPGEDLARRLCPRRTAIGADGLLVIESTSAREIVVDYRNADGSRAAFCGNGARCVARWVERRLGWLGPYALRFPGHTVDARIVAQAVEIAGPRPVAKGTLVLPGPRQTAIPAREIVAGVPHLVVDESAARIDLVALAGRNRELLAAANLTAFRRRDDGAFEVRTFERGVGETLACGSGALAVALAAEAPRGGGGTFTLWPPAGTPLTVTLEPEPGRSTLSGGAQLVFEGQLDPSWLLADASK